MLRKILLFIFVFSCIPAGVNATQVGFVPAGGIWFSRTELKPQEMIRVYTVVVNNNYNSLRGVVAFYDNDDIIETVKFEDLKKDEARQLQVFWVPSAGNHRISARFTLAEATNEAGAVTSIPLSELLSTTGQPLVLHNGALSEVGAATLSVEQKNGTLFLTPQRVLGAKITTSSSAVEAGYTPESSVKSVQSPTAALIAQAEQVASTITSTVESVHEAYATAQSWGSTAQMWYGRAKDVAAEVKPYTKRIYYGWLFITKDNDPVRIAFVVGGVAVVWFGIGRLRRRKQFYDDLD